MPLNRLRLLLLPLALVASACPRPSNVPEPARQKAVAPASFQLRVQAAANKNVPALQSFAFAEHKSRWLLVGGRTNGFHRTSDKERTFPTQYANESFHVVDPQADARWELPLPASVRDFLRTTNMEFYQDGDVLFLVGGYGSTCDDDRPECYQTYPRISALRVPQLIEAVIAQDSAAAEASISSLEDERFRVTGGGLKKLGEDFYLVFGQNYDKIYKGGYTGRYTESVLRFRVSLDEQGLRVTDSEFFRDTSASGSASQYHRRDLNVVEAIRPGGAPGITVYGGVFTQEGGGWANPIYIDRDARGQTRLQVDPGFEQKWSLYECASLVMYDPRTQIAYTTLFGGISNYSYDARGNAVPSTLDNWLPFIDTVTTLARLPTGDTVELPQPPSQALPRLMGANAVFVPAPGLARYGGSSEVLDYSRLPEGGSVRVGHIYGGIWSTAPQSGELNPTYASDTLYEVFLER